MLLRLQNSTGLGNGQSGVTLGVTIQTLQSRAQTEIDTIYNSLFNGKLQTQWGQLSEISSLVCWVVRRACSCSHRLVGSIQQGGGG